MKPFLYASILSAFVWGTLAAAQPVKRELPFGFHQFQWRMTSAEISALLLPMSPQIKPPPDHPFVDQSGYFRGPYEWRTCPFIVTLHFSKGGLDNFELDAKRPSMSCRIQMQEELSAFYGTGRKVGQNIKWTSANAVGVYSNLSNNTLVRVDISGRTQVAPKKSN